MTERAIFEQDTPVEHGQAGFLEQLAVEHLRPFVMRIIAILEGGNKACVQQYAASRRDQTLRPVNPSTFSDLN
jgi:hypothetical protein